MLKNRKLLALFFSFLSTVNSLPFVASSWWKWTSWPTQTPAEAWGQAALLAVIGIAWLAWPHRRRTFSAANDRRTWAPEAGILDLILVAISFDLLPGLVAGPAWTPLLLCNLLGWRLACGGVFRLYWRRANPKRQLAIWAAAQVVFALGAVGIARRLPLEPATESIGGNLEVYSLLLLLAGWRFIVRPSPNPDSSEATRRGLLLALAFALTHPWFSPHLVGTGDASLYFETLQEFLNQLRAGILPPWVSQSEIAPFGAVFPFRFATYYYYFSAALDVLTGGFLTLYAVQHLAIVVSFIGGGWIMYAVLKRLCPDHPWLACALAALYIASPAWLGPLYAFTMIFTIMTLPFIPLALLGVWPEFGAKNARQATLHGVALAATWHAHLPIGFWVSFVVALVQILSWLVIRPTWRSLRNQMLTWAVCVILCVGLWYSVYSLHYSQPNQESSPNETPLIMYNVRSAFPAAFLPAADTPVRLADLQLGYALFAMLGISFVALLRGCGRILLWLIPCLLLLALITPVPWLTEHLWQLLPKAARTITGPWPVQRLIGPLAATAVFAGALGLSYFVGRSRHSRWTIAVLMVAALGWSLSEAVKYVRRGHVTVIPAVLSSQLQRRENSALMSNWLAFHNHPLPAVYVMEKIHDPQLYNRVWSRSKTRVLTGNYENVMAEGRTLPQVSVLADPIMPKVWGLQPTFEFQGGKRYLLELTANARTVPGTFTMFSRDFRRTETGLAANMPPVVHAIWSTPLGRQRTEMIYVPTDPALAEKPMPDLLSYRLIPYDPGSLPIRIKTFIPYKATVTTPEAGWLETHRLFTEGYQAKVNKQVVPVSMSADYRVMIPVPAGISQVRLDYVGTPGLRISFSIMAGGWSLLILWGLFRLSRSRRSRPVSAGTV